MQPINYLLDNKSPLDALMGGIGSYQQMLQNDIANQAAQDKADYLKQAQQEAQMLDYNDPNAIRQFIAKYESTGLTKGMTDYVANLDANERQGMLADTSKAISLLRSGNSASAAQFARDKALAYKNAGMQNKAAEYEQMAAVMESHPDAALQLLQMNYAVLLPKDAASNYKNFIEAGAPQVKEFSAGGETGAWIRDPYTGEVTYQKLTDNSVSPDKQLDADTSITTTGMNNATQRYMSDNTLEGTKYSSDNSRAASQYSANMGYQGTVYSSDNSRAASQYSADRNYQGTVYGQNAQTQRTQMQIAEERRKAEVKEVGGFIIRQYADGSVDVIGKAQPKEGTGANSAAVKQQEESQRTQRVGTVLNEIEKILPNATGSMLGTGVDYVANAFGHATDGAKATAQLKSLSGQLIALMPKMSGPQSDKDVAMYREMAGNLADPTTPIATRMAALQTIRDLNNKYAAMNGGGYPAVSAPPSAIAKPQQSQGGYISNKYK